MTNEEIFRSLWKNLQEDVVSTINFQIETYGRIDCESIKKRYHDGLGRWSSRMFSEGDWLLNVENQAARNEVQRAIAQLKLIDPPAAAGGSGFPGVVAGVCVAAAVGVATGLAHLPPAVCGLGAVAGFVAGFAAFNRQRKSQRTKNLQEEKQAYVLQMRNAEEQIVAIWRKYDGN